jgi:hypothetical protein
MSETNFFFNLNPQQQELIRSLVLGPQIHAPSTEAVQEVNLPKTESDEVVPLPSTEADQEVNLPSTKADQVVDLPITTITNKIVVQKSNMKKLNQ